MIPAQQVSFTFDHIMQLDRDFEASMSSPEAAPKKSTGRRLVWRVLASLALLVIVVCGWMTLETYVFANRIHLLASEKSLRVGMTQEEVENLFDVKPEHRTAPNADRSTLPTPHQGVIRYTEMKDGDDTIVNYTGWYQGTLITSQHHVRVTYDPTGKVKKWDRGPGS